MKFAELGKLFHRFFIKILQYILVHTFVVSSFRCYNVAKIFVKNDNFFKNCFAFIIRTEFVWEIKISGVPESIKLWKNTALF